MGRRIRTLPRVDRAEFNGEPLGLQCHGSHHFDTPLFAVHLFHSAESGVKAIANTQRSLTPGDRSGPDDRISSDMTELPRDRFGPLGSLLGHVIAVAGIAMLIYTLSPAIRPPP